MAHLSWMRAARNTDRALIFDIVVRVKPVHPHHASCLVREIYKTVGSSTPQRGFSASL